MLIRDLKKIFIDTNTKRRINQHLINKNDVITDDDIRNINTNLEELKFSKLADRNNDEFFSRYPVLKS